MQARRRSPGDGPRSKNPGVGLRAGRISPENSVRGQGFYSQEYRGYSRAYNRGPAKHYTSPPPPPPPPRRGDVLMEAGRLAAEYLVSQGLLPAHLLPGRWANGSSKGYAGEFQDFRSRDKGSLPTQSDGRTSALARLGHAGHDVSVPGRDDDVWSVQVGNSDVPFYGRRRFADEQPGSRTRGRRRAGSFRGYGSDWSRENGRPGGHSSERPATFSEMPESEEDAPNCRGDKLADTDGEETRKVSDTPFRTPADENAGGSSSELETCALPGESSSSSRKDNSAITDDVKLKDGCSITDDVKLMTNNLEEAQIQEPLGGKNADTVASMDVMDDKQSSKPQQTENDDYKEAAADDCKMEDSNVCKKINLNNSTASLGSDLLQFCNVAKVPTRARSSLKRRPPSQTDQGAVVSSYFNSESKPAVDNLGVAEIKDKAAYNSTSIGSSFFDSDNKPMVDAADAADMKDRVEYNPISVGSSFSNVENKPAVDAMNVADMKDQTADDSRLVGSSFSNSENKPTVDGIDVEDRKDQVAYNSVGISSSESQLQGTGLTGPDVPAVATVRDTDEFVEPVPTIDANQEEGANVRSISGESRLHQEEVEKYPPGFGDMTTEMPLQDNRASFSVRSVSMSPVRDCKDFKDLIVVGSKRPREWPSPRNSHADDYFLIQNFGGEASILNDKNLPSDVEMASVVEPPPKVDDATMMPSNEPQLESSTEPVLSNCGNLPQEEKQLLPCSFQMFDMNFPGAIADPILGHVSSEFSASEVEHEASQHIGSLVRDICHNRMYPCNDFFNETPGNGKWTSYDSLVNINTIDAGVFHTALRDLFSRLPLVRRLYQAKNTKLNCLVCVGLNQEAQAAYSSLEDLLDHTRNADCLPKVHRGYGSAITDLLDMDLLSNSSAAAINALHSDVYLGFGEVLPCYDDPFYLSLEEISVDMPDL
ncbi:uncharacterized protein LOC116258785 [Nymphaea colorata]|nr:uncharacterized protein LOC116258785 [Nymphaea colorata]